MFILFSFREWEPSGVTLKYDDDCLKRCFPVANYSVHVLSNNTSIILLTVFPLSKYICLTVCNGIALKWFLLVKSRMAKFGDPDGK